MRYLAATRAGGLRPLALAAAALMALIACATAVTACAQHTAMAPARSGGARANTSVRAGGSLEEASSSSTRLYRVIHSVPFPAQAEPWELVSASSSALYLIGGFFEATTHGHPDNLLRVRLHPLAITTSTFVSGLFASGVNDAAFGLGALWVAAGDLVRIDPAHLTVTTRFSLPEPALLVTVTAGRLWVATATSLLEVDPATGAVEITQPLGFLPYAMAASPDGRTLYVVGDKQHTAVPAAVLSSFNATTGALLGERAIGPASTGPIATTDNGAWVPVTELSTVKPTATIKLYKGPALALRAQIADQSAAVVPYAADHALWLIDGSGASNTKCASVKTGHIYATGAPASLSLNGAMLSVNGRAFLLGQESRTTTLLEIQATSACMS
jgi:streptogramin lyase